MRFLLIMVVVLTGCSLPGQPQMQRLGDMSISTDTLWQGTILVDGTVRVIGGATLTIAPGTEVRFVKRDRDQDGLGDSGLKVEHASLVANGRRDAPIRFVSDASPGNPSDWLEIRVDFAKRLELRWCEISGSAHGLHAHFSHGIIEDSRLRGNLDGTRFGEGKYRVSHSVIEQNSGKGLNFRNSEVEIDHNLIRDNDSGLFIFETNRQWSIHHNNFLDNQWHLRLGDFFTGEIEVRDNWYGRYGEREKPPKLYDRDVDPGIGKIKVNPNIKQIDGAGPRDSLRLNKVWRRETGSFVDASPVKVGDALVVAGWDAVLRAIDLDGKERWNIALGEEGDSAVAFDDERVYLQSWNREILAVDRENGEVEWRIFYPESLADDHRQGGVARADDLLLVPAWNGSLLGIEAKTGTVRWNIDCGYPLRSTPLVIDDVIYQGSGSGRLTALNLQGEFLWTRDFGAPLLASPAAVPGGLAVVNKEGVLTVMNRLGETKWRGELRESVFYSAPLYADGSLLVATTAGNLYAFDPRDGSTKWSFRGFGPFYGTPAYADGRISIGDNTGWLHLLNSASGEVIGRVETGGAIQGTPLFVDDLLVVGSRDNFVHAWRLLPGPQP
ncbi:MAG: hypothetical protein C0616_07335 [Desulfuromonas sp.]|nr:MAG: hypothetical protein C0616_07335 [Desulfuromonas sp.]